jgi:hypothetical protein
MLELETEAEQNGVTQMATFEETEHNLAQVQGLDDELAAAWEAFQFTVLVADHYSGQSSPWFAKWMSVIPPACEGRDYLGLAPTLRRDPLADVVVMDLGAVSEDDAVRGLAGIAGLLRKRLQELAAGSLADARACTRAADAAAEIGDLLAVEV